MTLPLGRLTADGGTASIQIPEGQYMFAVSGNLGGGKARLLITVGPAIDCPVGGAVLDTAGTYIIWLPHCTGRLDLTGSVNPDISGALARVAAGREFNA